VTRQPRRVVIAGTAGGVGTTTITALLFSAWTGRAGAPRLADHTAGTLGLRLPAGDEVGRIDDGVVLIDAGASAFSAASENAAEEDVRLVLVTAATPLGRGLADRCLIGLRHELGPRTAAEALSRTVLTVVGTFGRRRIGSTVQALAARHPELAATMLLPHDLALAAGGRIPLSRLTRRTQHTIDELTSLVSGLPTVPGVRVSG
jgi:MinD-like ATPase involved in chromosome partitioning or flagellar assembly